MKYKFIEVPNKKNSESKTTTIEKKKIEDETNNTNGKIYKDINFPHDKLDNNYYNNIEPFVTTSNVAFRSDLDKVVDKFESYKKRCTRIQKANKWKSVIKSRRRYH